MKDWTDLHYAALKGDARAVEVLLAEGADPSAFEEFGSTPLHFAADHEHLKIVRLLLDAGASINAHDESCIGNTPLGEVAGHCSFTLAELLVSAGADPTIQAGCSLRPWTRPKSAVTTRVSEFTISCNLRPRETPRPDNALQRTAHGGHVFAALHVLHHHEPSLSLEALGNSAGHLGGSGRLNRKIIHAV